jgi:hypothetical protein
VLRGHHPAASCGVRPHGDIIPILTKIRLRAGPRGAPADLPGKRYNEGSGAAPVSQRGAAGPLGRETLEHHSSPTELAWAAGFLDGDGHIGLRSGLDVEWVQRLLTPLTEIERLFGPSNSRYQFGPSARQPRPLWQMHYTGARGYNLLQQLLPFLVVKQIEAELAIQCYEVCYLPHRKGSPRSPAERAELASYQEALVKYRNRLVEDE